MTDWDDAFENSDYIPGSGDLPDIWAGAARICRARLAAENRLQSDISYGPHAREVMDVLAPKTRSRGCVVFVHGGYWMMLDKSYWSHLAQGALAQGWTVAIPTYPLAPEARVSQITGSIRRAVLTAAQTVPGPLRLVGHSAGGHLVTRMAVQGLLPEETAARIARIVAISGVYQLAPLLRTRMNDTLQLTEIEAFAESPAMATPEPGIPVSFWVGARERPEFLRQTRLVTECWTGHSADVRAIFDAGQDHFSVIDPLADAGSDLTSEVLS